MFEAISDSNVVTINTPTDWKKQLSRLYTLDRILFNSQRGGMGPRANFGYLTSVGIGLALVVLLPSFEHFAQVRFSFAIRALVPLAAGFGCFYLVSIHSTKPASWTALLDQGLAEYDPVDKESYRHLQQRIRELGYFEPVAINDWLVDERNAIRKTAGLHRESPNAFVSKKL